MQYTDGNPKEQILSEASGRNLRRQLTVCGGDDSHIDLCRRRGSKPGDFALLNHAQKFDLCRQWQLAEFVQEQRASVRCFEVALSSAASTRESASLMSEEFRLHEFGRNRAAIHCNERLSTPCTS